MELGFLRFLQTIHEPWLDTLLYFMTRLGDRGLIWVLTGTVLISFKRYQKPGATLFVALALSVLFCNVLLKNIVMRPRPCWIDSSILTLIASPHDYSFPSGHAFSSFACAFGVYFFNKKIGVPLIILAALIAFSRLYFGIHYPSDVIFAAIFGIMTAAMAIKIVNYMCLANK